MGHCSLKKKHKKKDSRFPYSVWISTPKSIDCCPSLSEDVHLYHCSLSYSRCRKKGLTAKEAQRCVLSELMKINENAPNHRGPDNDVLSSHSVQGMLQILVAMCVMIGYSITTASFAIYEVNEHQSGAKMLQHIAGVSEPVYWIVNFFYDMVTSSNRWIIYRN